MELFFHIVSFFSLVLSSQAVISPISVNSESRPVITRSILYPALSIPSVTTAEESTPSSSFSLHIPNQFSSYSITPLPTPTVTITPVPTVFPTETPTPTNTPSPTATPIPTQLPEPTPTVIPTISQPTQTPMPVTSNQLDNWFTQYSQQYSIDRQQLWNIAVCESTLNPHAINGDYGGMYQFSTSTWISTRTSMNLDSNPNLRFSAEEAIKTAAFKISVSGVGAWKNCANK